jgi:TonB-dependent SusC/RagA subfamily outer membrane receptor
MKILLLVFACILYFLPFSSNAQQTLSNSSTSGKYTYIYQLSDQEMTAIAKQGKAAINDSYLHRLVDSFPIGKKYHKSLAFGNYLYATPIKNQWEFSLQDEKNVEIAFVNDKKHFQLFVKDLKGNLVSDATVFSTKGKRLKYNRTTHLYEGRFDRKSELLCVKYQGVSNFFSTEVQETYNYKRHWSFGKKLFYGWPMRYTWIPFKNLYRKITTPTSQATKGYLVFSKPKYKPLDTLKFKAFIVNKKGGRIKAQDLEVTIYDRGEKLKSLGHVTPYKPGAYEFSFVLSDSLGLDLDDRYQIRLLPKNKPSDTDQYLIAGNFEYEEYELKSIDFTIRADRQEFNRQDSVTVFMKATDENELAVPDGRVNLSVLTADIKAYHEQHMFVPDTLWKKNLTLEPSGETKLMLPKHIFPKANLDITVNASFLNSNNESHSASVRFKYLNEDGDQIKVLWKADSLYFNAVKNNGPANFPIKLKWFTTNNEPIDSAVVNTASIKADYRADYYEIEVFGKTQYYYLSDSNPQLAITAMHTKSLVNVKVVNEHYVPFWYTIFSGNKVIAKGYSTRLDTTFKHNPSKAVHTNISYFWDEKEVTSQGSTFYNPNELNVKLVAPNAVYPGQRLTMVANVTDIDNLPVPDVDLTAYAQTSKFGPIKQPALPKFTKTYYGRKLKERLEADELSAIGSFKLSWLKWSKSLGLDTIAYYKFTNHDSLYISTENTVDSITQFVPFVIENGDIDPVNVIYVDDIPVFFSKVNQLGSYAFEIGAGTHKITLRTATKKIVVRDLVFNYGKRTILSVSSNVHNKSAAVTQQKAELSDAEASVLNNYMIRVANTSNPYDKTLLKTDDKVVLVNPPNTSAPELLLGPFKENLLTYQTEEFAHNFIRENGYTYTFLPNLLKQKSFKTDYAFNKLLSSAPALGNTSYLQKLMRQQEIDSVWNDYLDLRSYTTTLFQNEPANGDEAGKLVIKLADSLVKQPYLKNLVIYQPERPSFMHIYAGRDIKYFTLEEGNYKVMFLLKDNSYYLVDDLKVKKGGNNYYEWNDLKRLPADDKSLALDKYIKSLKRQNNKLPSKILETFNNEYSDYSSFKNPVKGRVLAKSDNEPIPGVTVKIVGSAIAVFTNAQGYFHLDAPKKGKLLVQALGFESKELSIRAGDLGDVYLNESISALQEVVVMGYGAVSKKSLTGSVSRVELEQVLAGRAAGLSVSGLQNQLIRIRGNASIDANNKPLVIIDGVPFNGDIASLNKDDLTDIVVLKDASATAIYGARAANGVIIIKSKNGNSTFNENGEMVAQQQTMRSNFSDEGFWKPRLTTNGEGNATFSVKFPDDITSWNVNVLAMNTKKQSGNTTLKIKSFKSLSANLTAPQFAVLGDSLNIIGKLLNYSPMEEQMQRSMKVNGVQRLIGTVAVKNSWIDTLTVKVQNKDNLALEYTLNQANGYFDGEIRKIPVIEKGVKETKGYFDALLADTSLTYHFDQGLGKVQLRAETSLFPVLMDEIEQLRNYEYLCNEQMASKLKALLLEKRLKAYLNQTFNGEKDIRNLIKKLEDTKKNQQTWGWWKDSKEEIWISLHVVEALLMAQQQGFKVVLNKIWLQDYLRKQMIEKQDYSKLKVVELIYLLNNKNEIKDWLKLIEEHKDAKPTLYDRLKLMQLKQLAGLKVNLDSLLKIKKQTMFGNIYWGQNNGFWDNHIQNTLLAYQMLKASGNYDGELRKIINYFLEQRKDGKWRNTYESALILQTVLPYLLENSVTAKPVQLVVNGNEVKSFPYQLETSDTKLSMKKTGAMPVYLTAYQQFQNSHPQKVEKDFKVTTSLWQNGVSSTVLRAGTTTQLKIAVEVKADADYVMIEVPIPAGCSYQSKETSNWGVETHREYFKEKTSIFCTKLKQGKYEFEVKLMPRYNGSYNLNPAKAEMMYFPIFFGREAIKTIDIK